MTKTYEPDSRFVERLEWQLASEYRRTNRLKPAAGKVAVPRRMVVATLLVGVLLTGVAVIKAAEYIKDSWRKKIEVARVETEVNLRKARLELTREEASAAKTRFSIGLIQEEEYQVIKLAADKAALDLEISLLNQDEAKATGETPRNELYAPVVGGRDFVSERLKIERRELELDLAALKSSAGRLERMVKMGLVSADELDQVQPQIGSQSAMIDKAQRRLELRSRFVAGKIPAREVEISDRIIAAESNLARAQNLFEAQKKRLAWMQDREALGLISKSWVQQVRYGLDEAQAELSLAALEMDVLKKVK
ncbi:MAG: hypothetical protein ABSG19_00130 [Candidatus Aminicenantales bacterium]